ncbi:MAG: nuclear transport factor 2 family protein, partial [Planctomycetaceae bacterium]|nr:nuclear transport factor 2 family protein [Planctomycetaceae bacterium]
LFDSLNAHDHSGIAACYHEQATFRDIAFTLNGRVQIHAMWDMICSPSEQGTPSDIVATVSELSANDKTGKARIVDDYTLRSTGRTVHNAIDSSFRFQDGLIISQVDHCSAPAWARQAYGPGMRLLMGYVGPFRRWGAMRKLKSIRPDAFR